MRDLRKNHILEPLLTLQHLCLHLVQLNPHIQLPIASHFLCAVERPFDPHRAVAVVLVFAVHFLVEGLVCGAFPHLILLVYLAALVKLIHILVV